LKRSEEVAQIGGERRDEEEEVNIFSDVSDTEPVHETIELKGSKLSNVQISAT